MSAAPRSPNSATAEQRAPQVVLHEQRLLVGTVRVPTEQVVLRRRITTSVRQVQVTVRREELEVHRVPLTDQEAAAGAPVPAAGPPLVILLSEEIPVVQVVTRPYEQVTVHVDTATGQQQITQDLSRERAEVTTEPRTSHT